MDTLDLPKPLQFQSILKARNQAIAKNKSVPGFNRQVTAVAFVKVMQQPGIGT